jgi:hypothetical protein
MTIETDYYTRKLNDLKSQLALYDRALDVAARKQLRLRHNTYVFVVGALVALTSMLAFNWYVVAQMRSLDHELQTCREVVGTLDAMMGEYNDTLTRSLTLNKEVILR